MFLADLAVIMLCETDIFLKYSYVYVICSVERRIIDFGLAHLNWPSTDNLPTNQLVVSQVVDWSTGGLVNSPKCLMKLGLYKCDFQ